jgi:hypothetical protein
MAEVESMIISKYEETGQYADMLDAKLAIQGTDVGLHPTHEDFTTRVTDMRIMGIRPFGIIKASERGMVMFLNSVRMDAFSKMADALEADGVKLTKAEKEGLGNYINVATGAGNLGPLKQAAPVLSKLFFAPSFWASRIQFLVGQPAFKAGSSRVRTQVMKEYAKYYAFTTTALALASMAGWTTSDPRDTGFGKLKLTDQVPPELKPYLVMMLNLVGASASSDLNRVDTTGGLGTHITALTRIITPTIAAATGKDIKPMVNIAGEEKKSAMNAIASYIRSRFAPIPGAIVTFQDRDEETRMMQNVIGQKMDADDMARTMLLPLTFSQLYEDLALPGSPKKEPFGSNKKSKAEDSPTPTDFSNMTNEELMRMSGGTN